MAKSREPPAPSEATVRQVRDAVREVRDLQLSVEELEVRIREQRAELYRRLHEDLPEMFSRAGTKGLTLEPEGNLPAYAVKVGPYYHANIAADWDDARREDAFEALGELGGQDLVKTVITVELGRGERALAQKVEAGLAKAGVPFRRSLGVPWNTLTAFVRELIEERKIMPPLDRLGATVGRVVTIKKEKANGG